MQSSANIQKFKVDKIFESSLFCSALFDQKYSNNVKYCYNLK